MVVQVTSSGMNYEEMAEAEYKEMKEQFLKAFKPSLFVDGIPMTSKDFQVKATGHFSSVINSKREVTKLASQDLGQLLVVLEHRDHLSVSKVGALKELAALARSGSAEVIVDQYVKLHGIQATSCQVCRSQPPSLEEIKAQPVWPIPPTVHHEEKKKPAPEPVTNTVHDLDEAIDRISNRLGRAWTTLARKLNFKEYDIDSLEADYKLTNDRIARMFCEWREREGKRATYDKLIKALAKSRRQDLVDMLEDDDDD